MLGFNLGDAKIVDKPEEEGAPEGELITARLNARVQPEDRGEFFEDPLQEKLDESGLGAVTGGGTKLADEPAGIEYCDVVIEAPNTDDETIAAVIAQLEALGAPKGSKLIVERDGREAPFGAHEGIGLFLNGQDLPDDVYSECDVNHVIEECDRLMGEGGAFRGYWEGEKETALYFYGPSFDTMKEAITDFLDDYPLCREARLEQVA